MYDPSCTSDGEEVGLVRGEAVRLKLEKDSLDIARARSFVGGISERGAEPCGAGDVGRLAGLRNAGALSVYISFF